MLRNPALSPLGADRPSTSVLTADVDRGIVLLAEVITMSVVPISGARLSDVTSAADSEEARDASGVFLGLLASGACVPLSACIYALNTPIFCIAIPGLPRQHKRLRRCRLLYSRAAGGGGPYGICRAPLYARVCAITGLKVPIAGLTGDEDCDIVEVMRVSSALAEGN